MSDNGTPVLYADAPAPDIATQFMLEGGGLEWSHIDRDRVATVNPDKVALLENWENYCKTTFDSLQEQPDAENDPETNYLLGAYHAFRDAIDVLHTDWRDQEEDEGRSKLAFAAGAVIVTGAAWYAWKKREQLKARFPILKKVRIK